MLELAFDGDQRSCGVVVPDDLPSDGRLLWLDCGERINALLSQRSKDYEALRSRHAADQALPVRPWDKSSG